MNMRYRHPCSSRGDEAPSGFRGIRDSSLRLLHGWFFAVSGGTGDVQPGGRKKIAHRFIGGWGHWPDTSPARDERAAAWVWRNALVIPSVPAGTGVSTVGLPQR